MDLKSIECGGGISEFGGDVFEMEDYRKWTDASYKTYITPIGLPYPVEIVRGDNIYQAITFRISDIDSGPSVEVTAD